MKFAKIVIMVIAFLIVFSSSWIYVKKTNEKEQLLLSEVRSYLHFQNDDLLTVVKPTIFSGYEQWYVEVIGSNQKFHYVKGEVQVID